MNNEDNNRVVYLDDLFIYLESNGIDSSTLRLKPTKSSSHNQTPTPEEVKVEQPHEQIYYDNGDNGIVKVVQGYIEYDEGEIHVRDNKEDYYGKNLAELIKELFEDINSIEIGEDHKDDGFYHYKGFAKNVSLRLFVSDEKVELDELKEYIILDMCGLLETDSQFYGYSEWTIIGLNLETLELGGHDLTNYFQSNNGRYFYLEVEQ